MEYTDISQNTVINNLTDDVPAEVYNAALEAIIKEKPEFKKLGITELNANDEFQKMFRKYITENSPSSIKTETLKKIKNMIPNLDHSVAVITDKDYKHALSPYKNSYAYIQQLEKEFIQQLEFNSDNGTMNIKGNLFETITLQDLQTRSNLTELDLPLLRSLYR